MDFDDYDSYAPIRPDPPTSSPPPARHRAWLVRTWTHHRALGTVLGVLALGLAAAPFIGTEEVRTVAAETPATSTAAAPATRPPPTTTPVAPAIPPGDDTTVTRVVDGDTIEVTGGTRIRFIGIDTPETSSGSRCFGREATTETERMLPANQRVRLVYDVDRLDSFGRTLAYVYTLPDGRFVNLVLARDGFALQATVPPNVAHVEEFTTAVAEARGAGRGLWAACPVTASTSSTTAPLAARGAIGPVPTTKPPATAPRVVASYANCTAARAAGAAPLHRGDPGYRAGLDRDNDGVACE